MIVDLATYTTIHVVLSLAAIAVGIIAVAGLFRGPLHPVTTGAFWVLAVVTSATGFGFPFGGVLPSHIVGAVALIVLAIAFAARFVGHLAGVWRSVYAIGLVLSLYFIVFVAIAQAFAKIAVLNALDPTASGPPFLVVQLVALALFVALAIAVVRRFHPMLAR
jgi:hypothetical protein